MKFSPLYPALFLGVDGEVYAYGVRRRPQQTDRGYRIVIHKGRKYYVHRIVASIHCDGYAPGMSVDHVDGNKLNNDPSNLEWVSRGGNARRAQATGLSKMLGEKHGATRLTDAEAHDVRSRAAAGELQVVIAERYGVNQQMISRIVRGKSWKHLPLVGPPRPPMPRVMTPDLLNRASALVTAGASITTAARELGINRVTLGYALRVQKARQANDET